MWTDDYVGLPFEINGRTRAGIDCWGLVRLVYRDRLGIYLPSLDGAFQSADIESLKEAARVAAEVTAKWKRVQVPQPMDMILLRRGPLACHVGVVVDATNMLHIESGIDAMVEPYTGGQWREKVVGFFRYE